MLRTIACLLVACSLLVPTTRLQAADPFPQAASAYLIQAKGDPVWAHRPDQRLPPASLTKIMTALVTMEMLDPDERVTVSRAAAAEIGSRLNVQEGDIFYARDLLAALLIKSGNDVAHALADHIGGSEKGFAALMNLRAAELGLKNTHFVNAAGLDHPNHYSTASDLALLAEAALAKPLFRELVIQQQAELKPLNRAHTYSIKNSNHLLGRYPGTLGVKTGYTSKAGPCLVALAERDGKEILLVLLNSPKRWETAALMFDRAFAKQTAGADRSAFAADAIH